MQLTHGGWRIAVERMPPADQELKRMYDAAAPNWTAGLQRIGYPAAYRELFQRLQKRGTFTVLPDDARVLDAGIGTGAFSLALAQAVTRDLRFVGVDCSSGMLHEAQKRFAAAGITAELHHHDARQLSFADACFDLVISAHMLEHIQHPAKAIDELFRTLKPGGALVLAVTRPGPIDALLQLRWRYRSVPLAQVVGRLHALGCSEVTAHPLRGSLMAPWFGVAVSARRPV